MYQDYYYPSIPEDSYPYLVPDSEDQPAPADSGDWMNSQEYDPIMPLDDEPYDSPASEGDYGADDYSRRPGYRPAAPRPDRPSAVVPDRPSAVVPDRPSAVVPGRPPFQPAVPLPGSPSFQPAIPLPGSPSFQPAFPLPGRPVIGGPVRPDWSWNWGFVLPGISLPVPIARVRFYNIAVAEPVQIYVNNRLVVRGLRYLNYTDFYNVAPGRYRITIYRNSNLRTPIVDTWLTFRRNTTSTVALTGSRSNYWLQVS